MNDKTIPTCAMVNRLANEICGYTVVGQPIEHEYGYKLLNPKGEAVRDTFGCLWLAVKEEKAWAKAPNVCKDKNALDGLYGLVIMESREVEGAFVNHLLRLTNAGFGEGTITCVMAPAWMQAIAAIMALGKWPEDWQEPKEMPQ